ncbi:MAG: DUF86 domain-containing protein [Sphingomonadales bacterium]
MSINPDNELLKHMLDETTFILNHTGNLTREDYLSNEVLCRASIRSLEIIGETTEKWTDDYINF